MFIVQMQRLKEYIYFFKSKAYISKYARHLDYMIFGGDFNCVFEHTDRKSKIVHTDKSTNTWLEILDKFYLNDTWKKYIIQNADSRGVTQETHPLVE